MKITRVVPQHGRYFYVQDLEERNSRTGRPRQKWHKLTRVDEGEAALLKALGELLGQAPAAQGDMPALILEFQRSAFGELTFQVKKEYERMFAMISRAFVEFNARGVRPSHVGEFLKNFDGKPTAKHHYKARLSSFFSWCVLDQERTGVLHNPCREIRVKAAPKRRGRFTYEVFWKLHDALAPIGQCFMMLEYLTRQRPTEIRLLRESQLLPGYIDFTPSKTEDSSGERVLIRRTPEIDAELERARGLRPKLKVTKIKDDPYLIQSRDGTPYTKNGFYEIWRAGRAAAGVPQVTTRDLRAFALAELEKIAPLREVQLSAAHASITTTEGYLDQYRDRISAAALPRPPRPSA